MAHKINKGLKHKIRHSDVSFYNHISNCITYFGHFSGHYQVLFLQNY